MGSGRWRLRGCRDGLESFLGECRIHLADLGALSHEIVVCGFCEGRLELHRLVDVFQADQLLEVCTSFLEGAL